MRDGFVGRRWRTTRQTAIEQWQECDFPSEEADLEAEFPLGCLGLGALVQEVSLAGEVHFHTLFDGIPALHFSTDPRKPARALEIFG